MKNLLVIILLLICFNTFGSDTLNQSKNHGFIFSQFGTVLSIYSVGYGYEFYSKNKKYSLQASTGFGLDLIQFRPYFNFENLFKFRNCLNFNNQHSLIMEVGLQIVYNPWHLVDQEKYFPLCGAVVCPETIFNPFCSVGYQYRFKRRISLSGCAAVNYYDHGFIFLPGIQLRYLFKHKV